MKSLWFVLLFACGFWGRAYCDGKDREFERAILKGAEACFSLRVVDDARQPVADANVHALLGMNFREKANFVEGCTSTNGELRVEGKTTGDEIEFQVSKNGYYRSKVSISLITRPGNEKVKNGRWQPWGEVRQIMLRKIQNPILQRERLKSLRVPVTNDWIGVDLRIVDWVKPYGHGENPDLELKVQWDGLPPDKSKLCCYDMRVCGNRNGYYLSNKVLESEFSETLVADMAQRYSSNKMHYSYSRTAIMEPSKDFWYGLEAVFRVRTVIDDEGNIKAANYASVRRCVLSPGTRGRGALLELGCAFNPTPNDPNLEDVGIANRVRRQMAEAERREKARLGKERGQSSFLGGIKNALGL